MAGLTFIASADGYELRDKFLPKIEESLVCDLYIKESHFTKICQAGLISTLGSQASKAESKALGIVVLVDGYFVETLSGNTSSAQWFLEKYITGGLPILSRLNGSFNILIIEAYKGEVTLISDRYGTRPLFYSKSNGSLSVSYRANQLLSLTGKARVLNENLVANHLSYSRIWFGGETFFEGVASFPRSAVVTWSRLNGIIESSYEAKVDVSGSKGSVDELADIFKEVVSDFDSVKNIGLSLTGGLDSRLLLAAGFSGNTFTWGYQEGNDEIKLAKECAQINSNPWEFIKLNPEDFLDLENDGDAVREGLDLFVQSHGLKCYPEVKKAGVNGLMTGLALDFTMAGSYSPAGSEYMSKEQMRDYALKKVEVFDSSDREKLFKAKWLKDKVSYVKASLVKSLNEGCKGGAVISSLQEFFMEYRVRRYIFHRQQWQRGYCEDYIPTFDNRLVEYLGRFSLDERAEHKIFQKVLMKLSPKLSDVIYQGTNIPASVPTKFWKQATKLESDREALYRAIFFETDGSNFIPYNRYYSNFDEWIRTNNIWQSTIDKLLLSDDSRVLDFLNADVIKKWVRELKSGQSDQFGKIIELINLEKTLRKFF